MSFSSWSSTEQEKILSGIGKLSEQEKFMIESITNVMHNRKYQKSSSKTDLELLNELNAIKHKSKYDPKRLSIILYFLNLLQTVMDTSCDIFDEFGPPSALMRIPETFNQKEIIFENETKEIIYLYNNHSKIQDFDQRLNKLKQSLHEFNKICKGCQCAICIPCKIYMNKALFHGYCSEYKPCCQANFYCHFCNETSLFLYYLNKINKEILKSC